MSINIEQTLKDRFAAPLADNYKRRIIFWQDPDGEFSDLVGELCLDGVKILKLTGKNNFAAKMLLSEDDTDSNYLVYNPLSYSDVRDNWLLDIELYSEEFRADLLSIRMQELNMPDTPQMRKAMKSYSKFFENKERVAKIVSLKSNYDSVGRLHIDILSVLCETNENTAAGVIKALLSSGLDYNENEAIAKIKKFGSEEILWDLVNRYTGFVFSEGTTLMSLAAHILLTGLSSTMNVTTLVGFKKYISELHKERCYDLVNDWILSDNDATLYEIARVVEEQLNISTIFEKADIEDIIESDGLPCIDECILKKFMKEISDDIVKADEIVRTIEKRRTHKWYRNLSLYYDGLLQVAKMQLFYQKNIGGFHIAEYDKLWNEYCDNYCEMDKLYRHFHVAFNKSLKESNPTLDDLFKNVAEYVEKLYKNWFLGELSSQWTSLVADEFSKSTRLSKLSNQSDFYKNFVSPLVENGSRVYVIISDALRYEVAKELTERLLKETKGNAIISSIQSVFPSATKFGMAALLPHRKLQLTDDNKVACDDLPTEGTSNRGKVLNSVHRGNVAISYRDLLSMKQTERRDTVKDAEVVYIYHNTIDAMGDKPATEDGVFVACEQTIIEINNLVKIITNDLSGTNILITSDHGFLYSYKPLAEADKTEKDMVTGPILETYRRYIIAAAGSSAKHMLKVPLSHLSSTSIGFTPLENIRIKKQGGGMNYVHGGVSLQECVVPVIEFKNMRASSKKFVDVRKSGIQLLSQSRKISNSIFSLDFYQREAVGGKVSAATYKIYMTDVSGNAISDSKILIADKTDVADERRVTRLRFTLKSMEFNRADAYYLTVTDAETGVVDKIEFAIDIAFMNEFDF